MKTLSERLKAKRFELGLTQARLAELSGTKQQTIQQIESGGTTRPRRLIELADVLNCEPAWLLYGDSKEGSLTTPKPSCQQRTTQAETPNDQI